MQEKAYYSLFDLDHIDHTSMVGRNQIRCILEANRVDPNIIRWALDLCAKDEDVVKLHERIFDLTREVDDLNDELEDIEYDIERLRERCADEK